MMSGIINSLANSGVGKSVSKNFGGLAYKQSTHIQYGLKIHDLTIDDAKTLEAIRRLPDYEQQMRTRRQKVAMDLSLKHKVLPKEEWTKLEEEDLYLAPYLDEVRQEFNDRAAFRL